MRIDNWLREKGFSLTNLSTKPLIIDFSVKNPFEKLQTILEENYFFENKIRSYEDAWNYLKEEDYELKDTISMILDDLTLRNVVDVANAVRFDRMTEKLISLESEFNKIKIIQIEVEKVEKFIKENKLSIDYVMTNKDFEEVFLSDILLKAFLEQKKSFYKKLENKLEKINNSKELFEVNFENYLKEVKDKLRKIE